VSTTPPGPSWGTGWGRGGRPPKVQLGTARWLANQLADGPVHTTTIQAAARAAGITELSLTRAKQLLGVRAERVGREWVWRK